MKHTIVWDKEKIQKRRDKGIYKDELGQIARCHYLASCGIGQADIKI